VANPFPFSSGDVLTAADLNSIGERVAFTPSWTNFTPGNATETWFYVRVNSLLLVSGSTALGSTSSVGTNVRMDIPTGLRTGSYLDTGAVQYHDDSVNVNYGGSWRVRGDSNRVDLQVQVANSTYLKETGVTGSAPFTWATGDDIRGAFVVILQP